MRGERCRFASRVALGAILVLAGTGVDLAEGLLGGPLRWTASADWEYYSSGADAGGAANQFDSFRQKYALDVGGFLWDPRFNRVSLGLDLFRTNSDSNGEAIDTGTLGYRGTTTFFPSRPFPLTLFARRATTNSSGVPLTQNDRDTAVWGAEWNLALPGIRKLRLQFNRTRFDLLSPVALEERRKNGTVDLDTRIGRNDLSIRYGVYRQKERFHATDFQRENVVVTDRTRFDNGANLTVNAQRTISDALFSTGEMDNLTTSRLMARFDLPRKERFRLGWSYDFNSNDGRFVNSTSHLMRTQARVSVGRSWETDSSVRVGSIDTNSPNGRVKEDLLNMRTGVRYSRDWGRFHLTGSYAVGYDRANFDTEASRRGISQRAGIDVSYDVGSHDEIFTSVTYNRDNNDTTGVGFTFDEVRTTAGWEGRLDNGLRVKASAFWRSSRRDTFQFGLQDSEEYGLEGSLSHSRGGLSWSLSTRNGISDFFPDPAGSSVFLPGTDLVSRANLATLGAHWRLWRGLRIRAEARLEDRMFTSIGNESILSYHPQIDYVWNDWRIALGLSHYQRRNGTEFTDNTVIVRITRKFL